MLPRRFPKTLAALAKAWRNLAANDLERLNGQDPKACIVSANLARWDMTKGQKAIALAMHYPEPEKGGRGKKSEGAKVAETSGFSGRRLEQARFNR
jgi:hypothetical protein